MNKKMIIALIAFVVVLALAVGIYFIAKPKTQEGSKTVTIIVVHGDKTEKKFTVKTDAEYLEEVLLSEGIIKAEDDNNGMYSTFDGEAAIYTEENQAWWKLCEGDEMSVRGVKEIPVIDGGVYKMVYTVGFEEF